MSIPVAPMKATLADRLPPDDDAWAYEVKWDGMRVIAVVDGRDGHESRIGLWSAAGNEATTRFPEIAALAEALRPHHAVLDGEIVAFDEHGRPNFGRLQPRMQARSERAVVEAAAQQSVTYVLFDLLRLDGNDVTVLPYQDRHRLLALLVDPGPSWRVADSWTGGGAELLDTMRDQGMEGLIAKRLGSRYEVGRRSSSWLKLKVRNRQELVVGGWLPGQGNRADTFASLLVGYYPAATSRAHSAKGSRAPGGLVYAGRVGTGFTRPEQERLLALLTERSTDAMPFAGEPPRDVERNGRWVRPELVIEVEFAEWTGDRVLRHPAYVGQRFDKDPATVVLETASTPS